jgi:rare lipoprotein A
VTAPLAHAEPYAGPPYQIAGKWYVPTHEPNYNEVGIASWYGPTFHGKASASGETFDENAMTAAHPTLPIPSLVRVTNLENGRSVVVRLNDRGPFVDDRIIDLSRAAGKALDMHARGTAKVRVQYVGPAPAEANAAAPLNTAVQPERIQASAIETRPAPDFDMTARPLPPLVSTAPAMRPAEQRGYFLQAGAYADLGNAHAAMEKLKPIGPVSVVEGKVDEVIYYRVMVGPWAARPEAERAQGHLIELGTKAFVVARLD